MKILILMGLPASGKTTFAKNYIKENGSNNYARKNKRLIAHIDMDKYNGRKDKDQILKRDVASYSRSKYDEVIIDGLFLTNESIFHIIDIIKNNIKNDNLEIHYWKPDIESCLYNDQYRRNKDSAITIKNAKIEVIDKQSIQEKYSIENINIIEHKVKRKSDLQMFIDQYHIYVNDRYEMTSSSWCLGGSWGDCWGGHGTVSAEAQPVGFEQFDSLLQEICPQITFLQYKNIYNKCVSTETSSQGDYYGGSTEHANFVCNVSILYNELVGLGLIETK